MFGEQWKKYIKVFSVVVVVISSFVGFIKFFSVTELPVISGEFDLEDFTNKGRQLNFVDDVSKNAGKIVYFDQVQLLTDISNDRYQENSDSSAGQISYYFNFKQLANAALEGQSSRTEAQEIADLMSYYAIPAESKQRIEMMNAFDMSGSNAHIIIDTKTNDRSEYSNFSPLVAEGTVDMIDGPFQIKDISGGEAIVYQITAPMLDSAQKKQVECTKKTEWNWVMKKVMCQFL